MLTFEHRVRAAFPQVDGNVVKGGTDFLTLGLDSLMATTVRHTLAKEVDTCGKVLNSDIVFEHPTVDALTRFLVSLEKGAEERQRPVAEVTSSTLPST